MTRCSLIIPQAAADWGNGFLYIIWSPCIFSTLNLHWNTLEKCSKTLKYFSGWDTSWRLELRIHFIFERVLFSLRNSLPPLNIDQPFKVEKEGIFEYCYPSKMLFRLKAKPGKALMSQFKAEEKKTFNFRS